MPPIGEKAPDFRLPNQDGRHVSLKDFRGRKIVLFAYPKAGTSGCTKQAEGFRNSLPKFEAAGAVVPGLSPDQPEALRRWKDKLELPFDLLSDPEHAVLEAYGAWGQKKVQGESREGVLRSHWVIDEDGRIADAQVKISPEDSVSRACEFLVR